MTLPAARARPPRRSLARPRQCAGPLVRHPPWSVRQVTLAQQHRERFTLAGLTPQLGCHKLNSPENHQASLTDRFTAGGLIACGLGAYGSVDALAQEIRVTVVAAVLEQDVDHDHAQRDFLVPPGLIASHVE